MSDSAADVIADALTHHRPLTGNRCQCRANIAIGMGNVWETHLADVTVAALTQAGHLGTQPTTYHVDHTAETRWRAAALAVVAETTHQPLPGTDAANVQFSILTTFWPSLAVALNRLIKAKADLLKEYP